MPIKSNVNIASGERETPEVTTLSELLLSEIYFDEEGALRPDMDCIVIAIPDTGKAEFNGSHLIKSGKQAGKMSKATFIVAELGSSFAGEASPYSQGQGDVKGLPLSIKLSVTAAPPNREATTVADALKTAAQLEAERKAINDAGDAEYDAAKAAKANGQGVVLQA